ncbi:MAG: 4a-hydroxytetrahydrobiopterin dehydratase [Synechococcales bacterium]|nr:4a-hydroxytetrahydrobiopterin dehydratase [Cyanobacteria bacterium REEB444]MEB3124928.1 4a-hydroxytetrahydrobiopterin dehydratase [Synechococcales bacterium]
MARLLSSGEIQEKISRLPKWTISGQHIQTIRQFNNFLEAMAFVNQLIQPAESAGHHPDIEISYNRVTITLTTHDAGGLTEKDFELAEVITGL